MKIKFKHNKLISSKNVDAIYINDKYQDEFNPLELNPNEIEYYQYAIKLSTNNHKNIELNFHSFTELLEFIKAYDLEKGDIS